MILKKCPVNGCKRKAGARFIMCSTHWCGLSFQTKSAVQLATGKGKKSEEFRFARDRAIQEAEGK